MKKRAQTWLSALALLLVAAIPPYIFADSAEPEMLLAPPAPVARLRAPEAPAGLGIELSVPPPQARAKAAGGSIGPLQIGFRRDISGTYAQEM